MNVKLALSEQKKQNILNKDLDLKRIKNRLNKIYDALEIYKHEIYESLALDLNKNKLEVFITEFAEIKKELKWFKKNLKRIHKFKNIFDPLWMIFHRTVIKNQAYGTVLIYSPFNYPLQLSLIPMIGAIACNNTVIIKPSVQTPNTNKILRKIIEHVFNINECYILSDDEINNPKIHNTLYEIDVDMVFFTGGTEIGKKIYGNYAKKLIPVVLELGGKSPVIIDETADIKIAARRIVWAKLLNNGQTCVAPDYLIIHKSKLDEFKKYFLLEVNKQFPQDTIKNDLAHTINKFNISKWRKILQKENIIESIKTTKNQLDINLVLINNLNSPLMKEELFAPILPVITYEKTDEILSIIEKNNNPLALYLFTKNKVMIDFIYTYTTSGSVTINDCVVQLSKNAPFGGIKNSGVGCYHKRFSVETFMIKKPLIKISNFDIKSRYSPYTEKKIKIMEKILK